MTRRPEVPVRRIAKRDVYMADYTMKGHRVYYSVDSQGEQNGIKTVAPGEDARPKIALLWKDLERDDPITPVSSHRHSPVVAFMLTLAGAVPGFPGPG